MKIIIYGEPVAKARPKFSKYGVYTQSKTKKAEEAIKWAWKSQSKQYFQKEPLRITMDFYKAPPKNTSKKNLELMERKKKRPLTRPDIDNYEKLVLDALNNLAYEDDNQICESISRKYYSQKPRTEIEIEAI